jgi:hypothetical protein
MFMLISWAPYIDQGATAGKAIAEENCWFGIQPVISGNVTISRDRVVTGNAVVTKDAHHFSVTAEPSTAIILFKFKTTTRNTIQNESHIDELLELKETYNPPQENSSESTINSRIAGGGQNI